MAPVDCLPGEVRKAFPWWDDLHAFWRELPNYNPIGVQSSEPGTDHASAAAELFARTGSDEERDLDLDAVEQDEDGRSDWSKAQDQQEDDTGGDDYSHSSSPDSEDDDDALVSRPSSLWTVLTLCEKTAPPLPEKTAPPLPEKTAPPVAPAKKPRQSQVKPKAPAAVSGRDLGLAKANAANTSVAAKKKPQNALDRMNDLREAESVRLGEKRQLQHTEEMERLKNKRMKYELKKLQAENERTRLNRHATSQSPRRRSRVLNISSPSPSKSRSARYSVDSPRPATHFHSMPVPGFQNDGMGNNEGNGSMTSALSFDADGMDNALGDFGFDAMMSSSTTATPVDWTRLSGAKSSTGSSSE